MDITHWRGRKFSGIIEEIMSIGKIVYKYFFAPTLPIRYNLTHFGLNGWMNILRGELQMKQVATHIPPILTYPSKVQFNFLTGEKYWHQTIFCIQSFLNNSKNAITINIFSDGSLTEKTVDKLKRFCPSINIIADEDTNQYLNEKLPAHKFPSLNYLRHWHPFFKRMIDIHSRPGYHIHLDSDMLFFQTPHELIHNALNERPCYMIEQLSYSYFVDDKQTLKIKHGIDLLENVNGGIIGYKGDNVNYDKLEFYATLLLNNYADKGPARIEQTLMSIILAEQKAVGLDKNEYKIYYSSKLDNEANTLKHYIFKAKLPYFSSEWKKISL
ncbi:hypothetical protein FW774_03905 (plasmid) [Pedobacter sp. BS3]|uniref:hypothetical protein n=1 Tax=Pedobacter sp. BS3 TaxID=2567937 RepID=UPI0011EC5CFB|nr:hypothetical protein [Pedobacter sp. BS3]TZF86205.1 hypothetical protein FW774_03905 [Pedobacter sp. BS3]